ncbi:MAG TPA: YceI family protein [Rhodanobacteraceae bacterium]|nr:YceI family protein [Rhodanobacteraceae bacterium]
MNASIRHFVIAASAVASAWSLDARAAPETYRFDPVHSQIWFSVSHENLSHPLGRLRIKDGWFQFDPDAIASAKVYVEVDLASVDMGDAKWNDTIKSGQFFDTSRFATARYTSESVTAKDKTSGTIHGDLLLHGVTKAVDVEFKFNRAGNDPYTFKRKAGFSAQAKLNRNDFDMKRFQDVVGQDVALTIEIEGIKDDGAAKQNEAKPAEKKDDAGKE